MVSARNNRSTHPAISPRRIHAESPPAARPLVTRPAGRRAIACVAAAIVCGAGQASTPAFQSLNSQRATSASAWDLPTCTPPADQQSSAALGEFSSSVEAGPDCAGLGALVVATQDSTVTADGIVASGHASSTWGAVSEWHNASTSASSTVSVSFSIAEPTRLLASGLLWTDYAVSIDGFTAVQFGASLDILRWNGTSLETILTSDDNAIDLFDPFETSGVLAPGLYVLALSATSAVTLQGTTALIDIEAGFDVAFAATVPADLDGSGTVEGADVGLLLAAWGPCSACSPFLCPADLTGDCAVDGADLGALLANWGSGG